MNKKNIIKEFVMGLIGLVVIVLVYNAAVDYVEERKEKKRHEEIGKAVDEVFGNGSDSKEASTTAQAPAEPQEKLEFITDENGNTVGVSSKMYGRLEITSIGNYIKYDDNGNVIGPVVDITYKYTNDVVNSVNCASYFWTSPYQNGIECDESYLDGGWSTSAKTGASYNVYQTIYVSDLESPIELEMYTADSDERFEIKIELDPNVEELYYSN